MHYCVKYLYYNAKWKKPEENMKQETKNSNPYQRRHDTKSHVDQEVYVDHKFRASVSTNMIHVYACGTVQIYPGGVTKNQPHFKPATPPVAFYWLINYISAGEGTFTNLVDNFRIRVKAGDILIIRPEVAHSLVTDKKSKLIQKQLMLVSSPLIEWMCGKGGVQPWKICHLEDTGKVEESFEKIFLSASAKENNPRTELSILAYTILCEIDKAEEGNKKFDKFDQLLFAIRQAPQYYKTVEDLAREFGISERSLFYMFKKRMNMSPIQYIIAERLEKSRWYLLTQAYTITAVAEICGYNSVAFFSREFKKAYKISPLEYRQNYFKTGVDPLYRK